MNMQKHLRKLRKAFWGFRLKPTQLYQNGNTKSIRSEIWLGWECYDNYTWHNKRNNINNTQEIPKKNFLASLKKIILKLN